MTKKKTWRRGVYPDGKTPRPNRYISRIEWGYGACYFVKFPLADVKKTFSDKMLGGKRKALAAARAWRDETEQTLPYYKAKAHGIHYKTTHAKNKSGVVGVSPFRRKLRGRIIEIGYRATWMEKRGNTHHQVGRSFSSKKFGAEGAFKRACAARKTALGL